MKKRLGLLPFHPSSFCLHTYSPAPHPRPLPEYRAREDGCRRAGRPIMSRRCLCAPVLVLLALITPPASAAGDGDWPVLGHDAGRSGATPTELRPPFARKWYRAFPDEG